MLNTQLVNKYGAGCTPLLEELDNLIAPILRKLHTWAMQTGDAMDWAALRCCVLDGFNCNYIDGTVLPIESLTYREYVEAWEFGNAVKVCWLNWGENWVSKLKCWEITFTRYWAYDSINGMCAQIQIEKAMHMRKQA